MYVCFPLVLKASLHSVYQELGDGQVLETMEKHLHRYSTHYTKQTWDDPSTICPAPDIVLFQQAMEHATRLCRAMVRLDLAKLLMT